MLAVTTKKITNRDDGCRSAEVTIAQVGQAGWHVHTTYSEITRDKDSAGICGTVETEAEADELFDRAVAAAKKWVDEIPPWKGWREGL